MLKYLEGRLAKESSVKTDICQKVLFNETEIIDKSKTDGI